MKMFGAFLLLVSCLVIHVHAQGTVNFANNTATRVLLPDGTTPVPGSAGYRAELVYTPDGTSAAEFEALAVRLGADTAVGTPVAGLFSGGTRTAPMIASGGFGLFQVRVWHPAAGPDWRAAAANFGSVCLGLSDSPIMRIDTGDPTTVPPGTPTPLVGNGLTSIHLFFPILPCIPEPSTIALIVLGAGALLMLRRRK